jgi:hypothetical protein
MDDYKWNELVYNAKFSFEPAIGETYHLYLGDDGIEFLSLIDPNEWNKEFIASFKLNSDKKRVVLKIENEYFFYGFTHKFRNNLFLS